MFYVLFWVTYATEWRLFITVGSSGSAHRSVKVCARIRASSPLRGEGIYPVTPTQCPGPGRARAAERCATGCWPRQPCWYARAAAERCGWPRRALRLRLRGAASSAEAHTHCCADRCDTRRWPHVLSCACIAAQSRAAMVRRLSVWANRASVAPLIAIRSV